MTILCLMQLVKNYLGMCILSHKYLHHQCSAVHPDIELNINKHRIYSIIILCRPSKPKQCERFLPRSCSSMDGISMKWMCMLMRTPRQQDQTTGMIKLISPQMWPSLITKDYLLFKSLLKHCSTRCVTSNNISVQSDTMMLMTESVLFVRWRIILQ